MADLLRKLFYARADALGRRVDDLIAEHDEGLWREVHAALIDEATPPPSAPAAPSLADAEPLAARVRAVLDEERRGDFDALIGALRYWYAAKSASAGPATTGSAWRTEAPGVEEIAQRVAAGSAWIWARLANTPDARRFVVDLGTFEDGRRAVHVAGRWEPLSVTEGWEWGSWCGIESAPAPSPGAAAVLAGTVACLSDCGNDVRLPDGREVRFPPDVDVGDLGDAVEIVVRPAPPKGGGR